MHILGTVLEIIGSSLVLVKTTENLNEGELLKIVAEVSPPEIERHGLKALHVPKGTVRVLAAQGGKMYLAEVFRDKVESSRIVERPSGILGNILSSEIVKHTVEGEPSARLSPSTVSVRIPREVVAGDRVARA
jgi:hypothetical protein